MLQLHINGSVFDLAEDHSVADVFNFLNNYPEEQDGQVWLKLADGRNVHFQFDGQPTFAVVVPEGYMPEGLKVSSQP
ncbi:Uncharacterised protein [Mycolicibacterium vanbaalenii]|uniref:Uncharacterized protein n=1 Tax=Mycolicibacterium vanbaalenii TaxID=110539 RepID=A0A5S9QQR5_MYCVN|nr:hypothetical protein [Mycolicibacterium vanbaalenii]CAA0120933.1 Uncharacterised protein [Mycolicibacterium vanbaalenii]